MNNNKYIFSLMMLFLCLTGYSQQNAYVDSIHQHRVAKNTEFSDEENSPLSAEQIKNFKGLKYFKTDPAFAVKAKLKRTPDEEAFQMKTSTDRLPEYVKYGELSFQLNGTPFTLNVYRNIELSKQEEYRDYLFVPFTDLTSGEESYGGGRYLDVAVPEGEEILLDFNKAYNPYCAYNHAYSCPIPPKENFLNIRVEAGEQKFK